MQRHAQSGFTLVELLVSLALLAMTAMLLLTTLVTGRGFEKRTAGAAMAAESIAAAHGFLRERVEMIVPDSQFAPGGLVADVVGDASVFSFTAPPAAAFRPGPPQRFRLLLTRSGTLTLFSLAPLSTRADADSPSVRGWQRHDLLERVASVEISYFGTAPPDNQRRWRQRWQERPAPPELVRVRVGFPSGDKRVWPELIVHPATSTASGCRVVRITGQWQCADRAA